jgi:hypothetical protein
MSIAVGTPSGAFYDQNGASAQAEVKGTLSALKVLEPSLSGRDEEALDRAIQFVTVSLEPSLWQADGNHIKPSERCSDSNDGEDHCGNVVFSSEKCPASAGNGESVLSLR